MPTRLGRYAVRRRIGAGGFATVWLAYDEQLDSPVAVKVLADNWTEDFQVRTRFIEEGRYLRRVESPHVVSVYDAGELDDGRPYLVMTYADQGTLADRLQRGGFTVAQTLETVRQVGSGLQALHDRGIMHRDVKPANVLFRTVQAPASERTDIRALVGDLGLGKALDVSSRLTMIAGTPSFVAPEQAQGESPTGQADQYSLGVLTFLLLTGRTPWTHASLGAAAEPGPPPPLAGPDGAFTTEVEAVVHRALARDPADRWPSVTEYVEAFRAALDGTAARDADRAATLWLPIDTDLTQPGVRPSPVPAAPAAATAGESLPTDRPEGPPAARRRGAALVAGLLALVVGAGVGWVAIRQVDRDATYTDDRQSLTVTVPESWHFVARDPWTPPGSEATYAALSAGTTAGWADDADAQGVFVAILPDSKLPQDLPQHPGCASAENVVEDTVDGDDSRTAYWTGCPGVVVERVIQVAGNRVVWVQVGASSRATVNDVLASVRVTGL